MEEPKDDDLIIFYPKVDGIRKSPEETTPKFTMYLWVQQWMPWNLSGVSIKHAQEFFAEPLSLLLVPSVASEGIFLHGGQETESVGHFLLSILPWSSSSDKRLPGADS
jgi:hypothetical protein